LLLSALGATAQDGDQEMRRLLARPGRLLFDEELRGNCAGLTVTIKTRIDRLREFQKLAKKEQKGPPPTLFGDWPAATDYARERRRVEALNVALDAKGCKLVNIEEELQKTPAPPPATKGSSWPPDRRSFDQ
jgi:hypothetical protein